MLFQTAERSCQVPANTRAGMHKRLEVEEYQHFFSSQLADRNMGRFMVGKDTAMAKITTVIYLY